MIIESSSNSGLSDIINQAHSQGWVKKIVHENQDSYFAWFIIDSEMSKIEFLNVTLKRNLNVMKAELNCEGSTKMLSLIPEFSNTDPSGWYRSGGDGVLDDL